MWDYVFYIYNLNLKTEKVGLEYIIWKKMQTEDVSWIPAEGDDQEDIGKNIEALEAAIEEQKKFVEAIESPDG